MERIAANWSHLVCPDGPLAFWPDVMPAAKTVNFHIADACGGQFKFSDRRDAGRRLAQRLSSLGGRHDVIVLGLPRGGVPVAFEVAQGLGATLDVFIVRKLGVPGHEELAMGAIASGGVRVLNREVLRMLPNAGGILARVAEAEQRECERREKEYRGGRPNLELREKTVILVDDGFATGASMRAAVAGARLLQAARIVVAAPVGSPETCANLDREADEVFCLLQPPNFSAVGEFYADFSQTATQEVRELLIRAAQRETPGGRTSPPGTEGGNHFSDEGRM